MTVCCDSTSFTHLEAKMTEATINEIALEDLVYLARIAYSVSDLRRLDTILRNTLTLRSDAAEES